MPQFESHRPGTFCWPELATTDQRSAVAFYRELFGWDVNEQPIGPNDMYTMFQLAGREVAAGYTMREDERKMGIPPHWNNYIAVANVDEATTRAKDLGGEVLAHPFDVMDAGRMSVVRDPTGAVFELWQANRSIGARTLGEPGTLCWTELMTSDMATAEQFYAELLGWIPKRSSSAAAMQYTEFTVSGDDHASVGMLAKTPQMPPDMPSFWMPYFMVKSADVAADRAKALGGNVHVPPTDISSMGRFAVLVDPQGAAFAVFAPTTK